MTKSTGDRICTHPQRAARQAAAQASQEAWRKLTIDQQLKEISQRPGGSKRQVARLERLKAKGYTIAPIGVENPKPLPVEPEATEATARDKAPPKSDAKATKAWKRKHAQQGG